MVNTKSRRGMPQPFESSEQPAGRPIPSHPDALLYPAEAAFLLGLNRRTLEGARLKGNGPRFIALSRRAVRYRRGDLFEWIEQHARSSTSDPGSNTGVQGGTAR